VQLRESPHGERLRAWSASSVGGRDPAGRARRPEAEGGGRSSDHELLRGEGGGGCQRVLRRDGWSAARRTRTSTAAWKGFWNVKKRRGEERREEAERWTNGRWSVSAGTLATLCGRDRRCSGSQSDRADLSLGPKQRYGAPPFQLSDRHHPPPSCFQVRGLQKRIQRPSICLRGQSRFGEAGNNQSWTPAERPPGCVRRSRHLGR
jgi:hypothetical protein